MRFTDKQKLVYSLPLNLKGMYDTCNQRIQLEDVMGEALAESVFHKSDDEMRALLSKIDLYTYKRKRPYVIIMSLLLEKGLTVDEILNPEERKAEKEEIGKYLSDFEKLNAEEKKSLQDHLRRVVVDQGSKLIDYAEKQLNAITEGNLQSYKDYFERSSFYYNGTFDLINQVLWNSKMWDAKHRDETYAIYHHEGETPEQTKKRIQNQNARIERKKGFENQKTLSFEAGNDIYLSLLDPPQTGEHEKIQTGFHSMLSALTEEAFQKVELPEDQILFLTYNSVKVQASALIKSYFENKLGPLLNEQQKTLLMFDPLLRSRIHITFDLTDEKVNRIIKEGNPKLLADAFHLVLTDDNGIGHTVDPSEFNENIFDRSNDPVMAEKESDAKESFADGVKNYTIRKTQENWIKVVHKREQFMEMIPEELADYRDIMNMDYRNPESAASERVWMIESLLTAQEEYYRNHSIEGIDPLDMILIGDSNANDYLETILKEKHLDSKNVSNEMKHAILCGVIFSAEREHVPVTYLRGKGNPMQLNDTITKNQLKPAGQEVRVSEVLNDICENIASDMSPLIPIGLDEEQMKKEHEAYVERQKAKLETKMNLLFFARYKNLRQTFLINAEDIETLINKVDRGIRDLRTIDNRSLTPQIVREKTESLLLEDEIPEIEDLNSLHKFASEYGDRIFEKFRMIRIIEKNDSLTESYRNQPVCSASEYMAYSYLRALNALNQFYHGIDAEKNYRMAALEIGRVLYTMRHAEETDKSMTLTGFKEFRASAEKFAEDITASHNYSNLVEDGIRAEFLRLNTELESLKDVHIKAVQDRLRVEEEVKKLNGIFENDEMRVNAQKYDPKGKPYDRIVDDYSKEISRISDRFDDHLKKITQDPTVSAENLKPLFDKLDRLQEIFKESIKQNPQVENLKQRIDEDFNALKFHFNDLSAKVHHKKGETRVLVDVTPLQIQNSLDSIDTVILDLSGINGGSFDKEILHELEKIGIKNAPGKPEEDMLGIYENESSIYWMSRKVLAPVSLERALRNLSSIQEFPRDIQGKNDFFEFQKKLNVFKDKVEEQLNGKTERKISKDDYIAIATDVKHILDNYPLFTNGKVNPVFKVLTLQAEVMSDVFSDIPEIKGLTANAGQKFTERCKTEYERLAQLAFAGDVMIDGEAKNAWDEMLELKNLDPELDAEYQLDRMAMMVIHPQYSDTQRAMADRMLQEIQKEGANAITDDTYRLSGDRENVQRFHNHNQISAVANDMKAICLFGEGLSLERGADHNKNLSEEDKFIRCSSPLVHFNSTQTPEERRTIARHRAEGFLRGIKKDPKTVTDIYKALRKPNSGVRLNGVTIQELKTLDFSDKRVDHENIGKILDRELKESVGKFRRELGDEALLKNPDKSRKKIISKTTFTADSLKINFDTLLPILKKGTPEANLLREKIISYRDQVKAGIVPGQKEIEDLFHASVDYLHKKRSVPHSTNGKLRVDAAVEILEKTGNYLLGEESTATPDIRKKVHDEFVMEMIRNPKFCESMVKKADAVITKAEKGKRLKETDSKLKNAVEIILTAHAGRTLIREKKPTEDHIQTTLNTQEKLDDMMRIVNRITENLPNQISLEIQSMKNGISNIHQKVEELFPTDAIYPEREDIPKQSQNAVVIN